MMQSKPKFRLMQNMGRNIKYIPPSTVKSFYMDFETVGFKPAEIVAIERIIANSFYGCYNGFSTYNADGKIYHNG